MANLGHKVCDQTVGNVLQRHALPPAPARKRTTSWPAFIRIHLALLAGTDFLSADYVLFFIHLESPAGGLRRHYRSPGQAVDDRRHCRQQSPRFHQWQGFPLCSGLLYEPRREATRPLS